MASFKGQLLQGGQVLYQVRGRLQLEKLWKLEYEISEERRLAKLRDPRERKGNFLELRRLFGSLGGTNSPRTSKPADDDFIQDVT